MRSQDSSIRLNFLTNKVLNGSIGTVAGMGHQSAHPMEDTATTAPPTAPLGGGRNGKPRARRMDSSSDRLLRTILPHQSSLGEARYLIIYVSSYSP